MNKLSKLTKLSKMNKMRLPPSGFAPFSSALILGEVWGVSGGRRSVRVHFPGRGPDGLGVSALCVGVAALPAYRKEVKQPAHRIPDWLQPSPPPGLERYRSGCCRSGEPWLDHNPDMVTESSAVCIAANSSDFRIVTNDYTAEDSRCMSVKIGDVVVPGATTDFEVTSSPWTR